MTNLEASRKKGLGLIIAQAGDGQRRAVWGPASVEMESRDGKIITMGAIEAALPQLMRRARLSVLHKDQLVGEIHEALEVPPEHAASAKAERLAREMGGVFRTGLYTVTQAIADAFPKLRPFIGTEQLFVAATLYGDNATSDLAWKEVAAGQLDSFSISGAATEIEQVERDGPGGKRVLERVTQMDLSAVTLASSNDGKRGHLTATARNPAAALLVIQQSEAPLAAPPAEVNSTTNPPKPVQQTEPAQATPPGATSENGLKEALTEAFRRIENVETGLAQMRGAQNHASPKDTTPQAPPGAEGEEKPEGEPEPEEAAEAAPDGEEKPSDAPPEGGDEPPAEDDDEEKKKVKEVKQANPTPTPAPNAGAAPPSPTNTDLAAMLEQAVTKAVAPLTERIAALEQAKPTGAPAPAAAPATPAPTGRPSQVATPQPAAPAAAPAANDTRSALAKLVEAADSGDNVQLREAMREHGPRVFPRLFQEA